jgi:DNA-binding NtrC family response regulator
VSSTAGPITAQADTLTEDAPARAVGDELLWLRWCHPLPAAAPLALAAHKLTLGRDPGCDAELPSGHVSRVHAEIRRSGPVFAIFDRESKNGVAVNGQRVSQAVLNLGDVVRVGDYVAVVVSAPAAAELGFGAITRAIAGGHRQRQVLRRVAELAGSNLPLVLEGETGTGKELFARALHAASERRGAFLAVNCAVYAPSTAAAELFGFGRDGSVGADRASLGHVRAAHEGTLFLDEIQELSPAVQALLLRVLERNEVHPLGAAEPVAVNVRCVVATQLPLAEAVTSGRLRADLCGRLAGATIQLPRLAQCRELVPELLVELHRRRRADARLELSAVAAEALCLHDWSGNVRELEMLARRLAARDSERRVELVDLELHSAGPAQPPRRESEPPTAALEVPGRRPASTPYDPAEVAALRSALERHAGNVSRAVAELGISRARAYRMLVRPKPAS